MLAVHDGHCRSARPKTTITHKLSHMKLRVECVAICKRGGLLLANYCKLMVQLSALVTLRANPPDASR